MGNFLSRHAEYSTNEDVFNQTPEQKYDERPRRILNFDPRSPTAEIVRTPIQILDKKEQGVLSTPETSPCQKSNFNTPISIYSTKAMRSSQADLESLNDLTSTEGTCIDEFDNMLESIEAELTEIERSYKSPISIAPKINKEKVKEVKKILAQKLEFSLDEGNSPNSMPKKTRTPLGVRSSNTADVMSPSTYLRLKQQRSVYDNAFQKFPLSQHKTFNCENTPPYAMTKAATLPRKRTSVEWDKDATMII